MIENIKLEFFKLRHRKMYVTTLSMMGILFLWNLYAQKSSHSVLIGEQGWMGVFYNFATMNCILMPIEAAVISSKLVDIEHKGNTLKLLKTVQGSSNLFTSKLICAIIIAFFTVLIECLSIIALGFIGKYSNIPYSHLAYFMFYTFMIDITLILLQMILSFQYVNQMLAFVVAIIGSFLGFFSLFFNGITSKLVVWAYYGAMSPVNMDWDIDTRIVTFNWAEIHYLNIIILFLAFIFLYILGVNLFKSREE